MLRATMPASAEETAALLGRVPVFEELADDDLRRVAEVTVPRRFASGEVVFREGDDSDTCYVVHSGHARAIREHPDGRQITLATFGAAPTRCGRMDAAGSARSHPPRG